MVQIKTEEKNDIKAGGKVFFMRKKDTASWHLIIP